MPAATKTWKNCAPMLQFLSSSITTNNVCIQPWAIVLPRSLNSKPSAQMRQPTYQVQPSSISIPWHNLLQGCWGRGLKRRPLPQTPSLLKSIVVSSPSMVTNANDTLSQHKGSINQTTARVPTEFVSTEGFTPSHCPINVPYASTRYAPK